MFSCGPMDYIFLPLHSHTCPQTSLSKIREGGLGVRLLLHNLGLSSALQLSAYMFMLITGWIVF